MHVEKARETKRKWERQWANGLLVGKCRCPSSRENKESKSGPGLKVKSPSEVGWSKYIHKNAMNPRARELYLPVAVLEQRPCGASPASITKGKFEWKGELDCAPRCILDCRGINNCAIALDVLPDRTRRKIKKQFVVFSMLPLIFEELVKTIFCFFNGLAEKIKTEQ